MDRGALLLPDPSGNTYSCWTARGFDRTTERHLRIPADFIHSLGSIPVMITDVLPWKQYFSKREQAFLEPFLICPLTAGGVTNGVLLLADAPVLSHENPSLVLEPLCSVAGEILYKSRHAVLDRLSVSRIESCDKETVLAYCASVMEKQHKLVCITLEPLLYIEALSIQADTFRLYEDMSLVFASLVSEKGITCRTKDGRLLMVLETPRKIDGALLRRHIQSSVSGFLADPPKDVGAFCSVTICPDDVQEPAEALQGLLSD